MKDAQEYSGDELRAWRQRLKVSITLLSRIARVNTCELSYIERGVQGANGGRVKLVRALADIEQVIEQQRRPINLDPRAIERGVAELRRTKGRATTASSVKTARASA